MKRLVALLLSVLIVLICFPAGAAPLPTVSHVVQISVDALAAYYLRDYVSNSPAEFPNFARLRREGAFTFNARCDYFHSSTLINHTTVITGRPSEQPAGQPGDVPHGITTESVAPTDTIHNAGNPNVPYKFSVFDVVHDSGMSTAFFASKLKLGFLTRSYDDVNGADNEHGRNKIDFQMFTESGTNAPSYITSTQLVNVLVQAIQDSPWNYAFLHFAETDYVGHDSIYGGGPWGSPGWSNAVRYVDAQIGRILAAIDATPSLSNQIALIVTADHGGGGNWGGYSHDDPIYPINYTIPFFLWAPGIRGGKNIYELLSNRAEPGTNRLDYDAQPQPLRDGDACNIALALLGLPPIPGSTLVPQFRPVYALTIARTEQGLAITWPLDTPQGIGPEWADTAGPKPVWHEVTQAITTNTGVFKFIIEDASSQPTRFFRLWFRQ